MATPIINYPEVAILGVHKISRRPAVRRRRQIVIRDMMNLSISFDHRVVDGYDAARFVADIKATLETPGALADDPEPMAGPQEKNPEEAAHPRGDGRRRCGCLRGLERRGLPPGDRARHQRGAGVPPGLAPATLRDAFGAMLFARALGTLSVARAGAESAGGRPAADPRGREAAIAGALAALAFDDVVAPGRAELARRSVGGRASGASTPSRDFLAGKVPAEWRQRARSSPSQQSATQLPHAMGIAWAIKMQKEKGVALAFLDASETSAEDFHAALNFAGVYKVPVIFVCINMFPRRRRRFLRRCPRPWRSRRWPTGSRGRASTAAISARSTPRPATRSSGPAAGAARRSSRRSSRQAR